MYVLTLILKNEINNLNNSNDYDNFLNDNSPCKYLLSELRKKNDIKSFFKSIIYDAVENLETKHSETKLNFDIDKLKEEINAKIKIQKKQSKKNKNLNMTDDNARKTIISQLEDPNKRYNNSFCLERDDSFEVIDQSFFSQKDSDIELDKDKFTFKYLIDLLKTEFEKRLIKYKDNLNMTEYLNIQINKCKKNKLIFSNKKFCDHLFKDNQNQNNIDDSSIILENYKNDFLKVIECIDKIFENLINNINLVPYSLKCFCKIISILIIKKFPKITISESNAFLGKFFFKIIFSPIFKNPSIEALIIDLIISRNSLDNFIIISDIINQLVSGNLYSNNFYTPFNYYFLDKMPVVYDLFEQIINVNLSPFIEKLINDELEENYNYSYFDENDDEVMLHRSICFNLDNINSLIKNMNKSKGILFSNGKNDILRKTLEKLSNERNKKILEKLINHEDYEIITEIRTSKFRKKELKEIKKRKKLYFFLNTELIWNDNYKKLFSINQSSTNFKIEELKKTETEEEILKNNVIKVKNYFSRLLCNYRKIKNIDFNLKKTLNTKNILNELKIFMNSSNFVIDGSIPSEWYINALLEYLNKIPNFYIENDYDKLYSELENEINKSIKELDFEALSVCMNKMKYSQRYENYYEKAKTCILDIKQNEKAKEIIENEIIPVEIKFAYSDTDKVFSITNTIINKLKILDDMVYEDNKISSVICPTIESFTKLFPNLGFYRVSPLKIMTELKIPEQLLKYIKSTKKYLSKTMKNVDSKDIENISNIIYDYIMNKLYKKLFPLLIEKRDKQIFNNCILLSWTEPKHFIKGKTNYVYDTFLPDVMKNIQKIENEKSPRKNLINLCQVFKLISSLEMFNGGEKGQGVDDTILILNYAIVKTRPKHLYTNTKYIQLFIGENENKFEGSQLAQLLSICTFLLSIKYDNFYNISEEEFNRKCNECRNYLDIENDNSFYK